MQLEVNGQAHTFGRVDDPLAFVPIASGGKVEIEGRPAPSEFQSLERGMGLVSVPFVIPNLGARNALLSQITFKDGRVEQSNFHDYQVARMNVAPRDIRVHLIGSDFDGPLGGVGELAA